MITEMDRYWLRAAMNHAADSRDPSTQVGAVVVALSGAVAPGHNHFVTRDVPETREERYAAVVHAEAAALLGAGRSANGSTLYCTHEPCGACWNLIVAAGVARVVALETSPDRRARWGCDGPGRQAFLGKGGALEVYK